MSTITICTRVQQILWILSWLFVLAPAVCLATDLSPVGHYPQLAAACLAVSVVCRALARGTARAFTIKRTNKMAQCLKHFVSGAIPATRHSRTNLTIS